MAIFAIYLFGWLLFALFVAFDLKKEAKFVVGFSMGLFVGTLWPVVAMSSIFHKIRR